MGSFLLVWFEAPDIEKAFTRLATSGEEFTIWFRGQVKDVTGVDLGAQPESSPPVTLVDCTPLKNTLPRYGCHQQPGVLRVGGLRHTSLRLGLVITREPGKGVPERRVGRTKQRLDADRSSTQSRQGSVPTDQLFGRSRWPRERRPLASLHMAVSPQYWSPPTVSSLGNRPNRLPPHDVSRSRAALAAAPSNPKTLMEKGKGSAPLRQPLSGRAAGLRRSGPVRQ
jgi:hypothetical protein